MIVQNLIRVIGSLASFPSNLMICLCLDPSVYVPLFKSAVLCQ